MGRTRRGKDEATIVKKYANRRLYDTGRSSYVTLDDLAEMVREGHNFVVQDAKTGEDITRSVLAQIILEQEGTGDEENTLLPTGFMRKLIGMYGGAGFQGMQGMLPNYLETTLDLFMKNQEQMRQQLNQSLSGMPGMKNMGGMFPGNTAMLEEMNRKNLEIFERTMKMFSPFGNMGSSASADASAKPAAKDKTSY